MVGADSLNHKITQSLNPGVRGSRHVNIHSMPWREDQGVPNPGTHGLMICRFKDLRLWRGSFNPKIPKSLNPGFQVSRHVTIQNMGGKSGLWRNFGA